MPVNITGGGLEFDATINGSQFQQQIRNIERDLNRLASTTEQRGEELEGIFKRAAVAAASFFSIQQAGDFIKQLVEVRGQFEQLEVAYSTILKSKAKGDALFKGTIDLAATTPFNLTEVAQSTKQLLAYGVAAKDVTGTLRMLGDVAAGVSAPIGDIAYLYGTLKTQGRAYMMDIRQFTGRGIPIIEALAKQFHIVATETETAGAQVNKLIEAGKVGFPEVEKAFQGLTGAGGIFFNLMQRQSETLTGRLSNLQDSFAQMLNNIGKANSGILNDGITALSDLVDHYQEILTIIELLIVAYGSYRTALLVEVAVSKIVAVANAAQSASHLLLQGAIEIQTAAQLALNSAMVQGAVVTAAYTTAIAAIALAIYAFTANTDSSTAAQHALNEVNAEGLKTTQKQVDKLTSLNKVISDSNRTEDQRLKAVKTLRDVVGDRLKQYSDEEILAGKAKKAIRDYTDEVVRSGKTLAAQSKINDIEAQLLATDPTNQVGDNYADRVSQAYSAIPDRIAAKLTLKRAIGMGAKASVDGEGEVREYREFLQNQKKKLLEVYGKYIDDLNAGIDETTEAPGKKVRNEAFIKKQIEDLTELRAALDIHSKAYRDYTKKITALEEELQNAQGKTTKSQKEYNKELNERNDILQKVFALQQKYNTNALSDDKAKLKSIKDEFSQVKKAIDDYNKTHKVQINGAVLKNINSDEDAALKNQTDLNSNEALKKTLDEKKQLYAEYEAYREKLGDEAAEKEYSNLLRSGKSFTQYLGQLAVANALNLDHITDAALQARTDFTNKLLTEASKEDRARYIDALASTLDFNQKSQLIIEKYLKRATDLRNLAANAVTKEQKAQYEKQAEQALSQGEVELMQLKANAESQIENVLDLSQTIENLTAEQAKFRIEQAKIVAKAELAAGNITKKHFEAIMKIIQDAEDKINNNTIVQGLDAIGGALSEISQAFAGLDDNISRVFDSLSRAFLIARDLTSNIAKLKDAFKNFSAAKTANGGGFFGTVSAITNIIPIVGTVVSGVISVVKGVVNFFKASSETAKQSAAELLRYQDSLVTGEINYNELLRDRARTQDDITDLTIKELEAREKMLETQKQQAESDFKTLLSKIQSSGQQITGEHTEKYGGFLGIARKTKVVQDLAGLGGFDYDQLEALFTQGKLTDATKTWFEELQKVHDEFGDIDTATNSVKDQLNQIFTGTTADSLEKAILDGLMAGKRGFADFADDFSTTIQNALASTFESNFLKDKVAAFYQTFAELSESGGGLDADELTKLRDYYTQLIDGASAAFDDIQKITGQQNAGSVTSSSAGQIQAALTENTATEFIGIARGTQLNTYNSYQQLIKDAEANALFHQNILDDNVRKLFYLESIDKNTKRTGDNTDGVREILKDIKKNTGDTTSAVLRAAGI
jgi:hypothetical protein